ncbi:MAG: ankyrin repeat domain-containing protein [archaeon]|nr:ankyrin repeat domain-containing protein [archaeon]
MAQVAKSTPASTSGSTTTATTTTVVSTAPAVASAGASQMTGPQLVDLGQKKASKQLVRRNTLSLAASQSLPGWTPLHLAARYGHEGTVRELCLGGANVHAAGPEGWTPLHLAVYNGHEGTVRELLARGADPARKTRNGDTPLHLALRCNKNAVVQALRAPGLLTHAAAATAAERSSEPISADPPLVPEEAVILTSTSTETLPSAFTPLRSTAPRSTSSSPPLPSSPPVLPASPSRSCSSPLSPLLPARPAARPSSSQGCQTTPLGHRQPFSSSSTDNNQPSPAFLEALGCSEEEFLQQRRHCDRLVDFLLHPTPFARLVRDVQRLGISLALGNTAAASQLLEQIDQLPDLRQRLVLLSLLSQRIDVGLPHLMDALPSRSS